MAKSKRTLFNLECTICKSKNYTTVKNADNIAIKNKGQNIKLAFNKYCKRCRKAQQHREVKI